MSPLLGFTKLRDEDTGQFKRDVEIDKLAELFVNEHKQGSSLNEIANKYERSLYAVRSRLIEQGISESVLSSHWNFKKRRLKSNIDERFIIWLAGFFEGDGCIHKIKKNSHYYYHFTVAQSDKTILEYIKNQLGVGSVTLNKEEKQYAGDYIYNRPFYSYQISSTIDVLELLKLLRPHIKICRRKHSVDEAIKYLGEKIANHVI